MSRHRPPTLIRPFAVAVGLLLATTAAVVPAAAAPPAEPGTGPSADPAAERATPRDPDKSFAVYVGKNLTQDGATMLGGFGHEPSSHWVEVVPAQDHPEGSTITVGATPEADMPARLTEIPQAEHTARYITSNYSEFAGFPAPLTNGGLNEHGVAARDVWSNSREELWDMTPEDQTGPQYSDLSRIAMERATSAREAVQILGDLIDEHGFTTYGGNSHLFADENEGWVFVEFSGGEGLWAAERLGPDEIRVSYPGYIQDFPVEAAGGDHPDYMGSANLVSFAEEQGWYDPETDETFDLQQVYGQPFPTEEFDVGQVADPEDPAPYRNPISLEREFAGLGDQIRLEDVMRIVRDPRWSDDRSGYGHVAQLPADVDPALRTLWVAPTAAATAPYIPIAIGTEELPVEYTQHRYLTAEASSTYLSPEYAEQEATEYATQTYKRLMYATCSRPEEYLGEVTAALEGFEAQSITDWREIQEEAAAADDPGTVLTDYTYDRALEGLALGNHLLDDVLARSRQDGGLRAPEVDVPPGTTASGRSLPMAMEGVSARDRMNCDVGGGWQAGNATERAGEYGDPADVPDYSAARISGNPDATGSGGSADDGPSEGGSSPAGWVWGVLGVVVGAVLGGLGAWRAASGRR
ncbi:C69 family dipeptidase [Georgenia alba]|uniref:C69 family dipeptidase n=1 Tax=Georgenia alba TaxID=2233858 RepID=A0ABW2Q2Y2_9MICO